MCRGGLRSRTRRDPSARGDTRRATHRGRRASPRLGGCRRWDSPAEHWHVDRYCAHMRQLTSLDAQFLALENSRQTGHVGSLAMLDASTAPGGQFGCAQVTRLLSERASQLPPLRWRLAEVPLGLDHPYWVEEAEMDLGYHVREMALASPGTDAQLAEQVARFVSRPLDRARPLWELYVIEGLESGRIAVLTKIHHALIDGLSGAEIMALLAPPPPGTGRARGAGRA